MKFEPPPPTISAGELAARLVERSGLHLWNVLTDDCADGRSIPGAVAVPLDRLLRTARAAGIAGDAEIVVFGSGPACPQGRLAAEKLRVAGFERVLWFAAGLAGWEAAAAERRPSTADA